LACSALLTTNSCCETSKPSQHTVTRVKEAGCHTLTCGCVQPAAAATAVAAPGDAGPRRRFQPCIRTTYDYNKPSHKYTADRHSKNAQIRCRHKDGGTTYSRPVQAPGRRPYNMFRSLVLGSEGICGHL
jgi:hypothetical protein